MQKEFSKKICLAISIFFTAHTILLFVTNIESFISTPWLMEVIFFIQVHSTQRVGEGKGGGEWGLSIGRSVADPACTRARHQLEVAIHCHLRQYWSAWLQINELKTAIWVKIKMLKDLLIRVFANFNSLAKLFNIGPLAACLLEMRNFMMFHTQWMH